MTDRERVVKAPSVVISASLAFDYIMTFPGSFRDHILPDKTHVLSVSFLVDALRRLRGGVAGNIAYNLALLGEQPAVVGAGGTDFVDYRATFEALGIDMRAVLDVPNELTASAFMMVDSENSQVAAFYPGASNHAAEISIRDLAAGAAYGLIGATAPGVMRRHATEIAATGCRLIYDGSKQLPGLPPEHVREAVDVAWAMVGNDYEYAMIGQKTGLSLEELADRVELFVITYGKDGSELRRNGRRVHVPAALTDTVRDPTGAGDAYLAGLVKGLLLGLELELIGRLASLTATYAIEHLGTQEHVFTPEAFVARFDAAYPDYTGAIAPDLLRSPTHPLPAAIPTR
jgi:adenosine kinase